MNPRLRLGGDGVGHLVFDDPARSQNVLTEEALEGLDDALSEAAKAADQGVLRVLLVRSAKPRSFIAGADVGAIAAISNPRQGAEGARRGQALFGRIADLPVPSVAAVRGVCLGGGTELALACTHRLAADGEATRIGLPEVQLGILPAWGGTTRLPRLVGLRSALTMILSGKPVGAAKARRMGLVDHVFPDAQFEARSAAFAQALAERPGGSRRAGGGRAAGSAGPGGAGGAGRGVAAPPRRVRRRGPAAWFLDETPPGRAIVLRTARKQVVRRTGGHYPAPLAVLDMLRKGPGRSVEASLEMEARAAGALVASSACKNLLFLFRLRERAVKGPWGAPGAAAQEVDRIAVIGAGVMGGGIAQLAAYRDIPARMKDVRHDAVGAGLAFARSVFDKAVERRKLSRREADAKMALVSGGLNYAGLGQAGVVVEAVVERMDVKRQVLAEAEAAMNPDAVLATNTSSLSVDAMAAGLRRPAQFAGMHFFNPVHRMPLVEVVRGKDTDPAAVETIAALAVRLGKVPVVTADGPGFLVNRILGSCLNEAGHMLDDGLDAQAVDRAWTRFGMPMGPYRLFDEIGIDVAHHAGASLAAALGERMTPAPALAALAESGRLGRKGGLGFYRYRNGRAKGFDSEVYRAMGRDGIARRTPDAEEVRERLVLTMVNEAARVLEEGIVVTAADVDLGMVMGTGFPPFRGGLLKYADDRGLANVVRAVKALGDRFGARFEPSPLLLELGARDGAFHEAYPARA